MHNDTVRVLIRDSVAGWRPGNYGISSLSLKSCTSGVPRSGSGSRSHRCHGRSSGSNAYWGSAVGQNQSHCHADRGRPRYCWSRAGRPRRGRGRRASDPPRRPFRDRPPRPGPGHEGQRVQGTAGETARRVRRRTRRGPRRRHPVRSGRAGTTPARGPGRRGAAAPAVRLDGRIPHRRAQHGEAGCGPACSGIRSPPGSMCTWPTSPGCRACPSHAGPTPTAATRPAPAHRSATMRSCCSSSRSAVPVRSHRSRAEPNCTVTSPPCPCWTRRRSPP